MAKSVKLSSELWRRVQQCAAKAGYSSGQALAALAPWAASMNPVDGRAGAYVCRNYTCQLPVSEPAKFAELIQY